jgi:hypothetical protein
VVRLFPSGNEQPYVVGFFGSIALAGSILLYLFGSLLESSPLSMTSFAILSGVTEEWLFRMWLCAWIYKITRSVFIAVPISSFLWAVFHIGRVSGELTGDVNIMYLAMFGMLMAGVALSYFFVGFRVAPFNFKSLLGDMIATVASVICIYYLNAVLPQYVSGEWYYLGLVFVVGLPLGYLTLLFRSADGPTFGHMIINALSGG